METFRSFAMCEPLKNVWVQESSDLPGANLFNTAHQDFGPSTRSPWRASTVVATARVSAADSSSHQRTETGPASMRSRTGHLFGGGG